MECERRRRHEIFMAGDAVTRMGDEARGGAKVMVQAGDDCDRAATSGESEARGDAMDIGPDWGQSLISLAQSARGAKCCSDR